MRREGYAAPPVGPALGQAQVNIMEFLQTVQRPHFAEKNWKG